MKKTLFILCTPLLCMTAHAAAPFSSGSLAKSEVNVRSGPGTQFPILWVFKRKGYPVDVLESYHGWYKIRDIEGEQGWIYKSLISRRNTALVTTGAPVPMYKKSNGLRARYKLEQGVIVSIIGCTKTQCHVSHKGEEGWVTRKRLTYKGL